MKDINYTYENEVYIFTYEDLKYEMPKAEYEKNIEEGKDQIIILEGEFEMVTRNDIIALNKAIIEMERLGYKDLPSFIRNKLEE